MIKRQFYSLEHRSRDDGASSASSSSSSSAHESAASSGDDEAHSPAHEEQQQDEEASSPAGPISESSDADEGRDKDNNSNLAPGKWRSYKNLDVASDGEENLLKHHRKRKQESSESNQSNQWADLVAETLKEEAVEFTDECVVNCKSVLKCRLCPKTICLTSETMQAHLASKKHARSLKLMKEGKLKVMLNSDGEEEEQGETHAERHARIVASFKEVVENTPKRKRASGRQRQRKRAKKKALQERKNKACH
eukprot:c37026_g1_i1 orf=179-931(+)